MLKLLHRIRWSRPTFHNQIRNLSSLTSDSDVLNEVANKHITSRSTDGFLHSIRTSTDALDLFDVISRNDSEKLTGSHVVQSLRCLYNLQKNGE